MELFKVLNEELCTRPEGVFAPYYYRFIGYKKDLAAPVSILRANGIHALFTETTPYIYKNELIAGNKRSLFSSADPTELEYAEKMVSCFGEREFITNKDHFAPDYAHVLQVGITGLMDEISVSLQKHWADAEKCEYLQAMQITLDGFLKMIENYSQKALQLKTDPDYSEKRLDFIIENCTALLHGAPQNFSQALQLCWFCHLAFTMEGRYAMALGRMDQYLYPFYKKDLESHRLNDEDVTELLENVFIRLQDDIVNICIGGMNADGECQVNGLSYCILQAVKSCNVPGPNLSARITPNTPDRFLDECLQSIGTGLGYPALMNDTVNIAALKKYGYETDDVYSYCMVGCIENFIPGMQPPWSDGRFDPPRFFDYVFNNGISRFNHSAGLNTGDLSSISTMEQFMQAFEKQLAYGADEYYAKFNSQNSCINQEYFSQPFLSCFCRDCIGRGLDINCGGSKYPSVHGAALMGVGTVSDSLAAIEKIVFLDKKATLNELRDALNCNFEGYEELREELLRAPKYGNNDDFVDKYAVWFVNYFSRLFSRYKTRDGGRIYLIMAANVSNIYAGQEINATPDGRKAGEPLSDAASPTYGRDTRGATAAVTSVSKPDYTKVACGSVVNQKYSPSIFEGEKRKKLASLIRTYFKKGGQEIQINSTSRAVLQDAMENPEKYANLVVRVSGFSAFYTTLSREVQTDILNRTQQE